MSHDRPDGGGYDPPQRFHLPRKALPPGDERHPDNNLRYRRPRAWLNAKRAFGVVPGDDASGGEPGRAMVLLERFGPGDPRSMLAVAVHLFLTVSREAQAAAAVDYDARPEKGAPAVAPAAATPAAPPAQLSPWATIGDVATPAAPPGVRLTPGCYDRTDEQGRHVCPHCPRRFRTPGGFGKHVRRAHGIEPYTGAHRHDAPPRDYGRRDGKGRHVCPDCPRRFASVSGFLKHCNEAHGVKGDDLKVVAGAALDALDGTGPGGAPGLPPRPRLLADARRMIEDDAASQTPAPRRAKPVRAKRPTPARPGDYRLTVLKGRLYVDGVPTDFFVDTTDRTGQVIDPGDPIALARAAFAAGWEAAEAEREERAGGKGARHG